MIKVGGVGASLAWATRLPTTLVIVYINMLKLRIELSYVFIY